MERAVVLISVSKTGQLPGLNAAASGVRKIVTWAENQHLLAERVKILTDDTEAVTVARIRETIKELANLSVIEQLVIYFSGHGMYLRDSEFWLLSNCPDDRQEAVNLALSVDSARQSIFPHVMFFSDACRTPPSSIQFQRITGSDIFPNSNTVRNPERSVDLFFACGLGSFSNETRDPAQVITTWRSIYTDTLCDALVGAVPQVLEVGKVDGNDAMLVHPWPLKDFLTSEVPARVLRERLGPNAFQTPDARICSNPSAWVSLFPATPIPPPLEFEDRKRADLAADGGKEIAGLAGDAFVDDVNSCQEIVVQSRPHRPIANAGFDLDTSDSASVLGADLKADVFNTSRILENSLRTGANPFESLKAQSPDTPATRSQTTIGRSGIDRTPVTRAIEISARKLMAADKTIPDQFESGSGFYVTGAVITGVRILGSDATLEGQAPDSAKIRFSPHPPDVQIPQAANVFLTFKNGRGTVLPSIPFFIGSLAFQDDSLVSVSYETTQGASNELRAVRALIASMSQKGAFRLDATEHGGEKNAEQLAMLIRNAKSVDPSMAVYAAYAFYDLQLIRRISDMALYLRDRLNFTLFDLALLSRNLSGAVKPTPIFPFFPLLTRGWALLNESNSLLPPSLADLYGHLTDSQWSLFDSAGVALLTNALNSQVV